MADNHRIKLVVVGPSSPHVLNHLGLIEECTSSIVVVTPQPEAFPKHYRSVRANFSMKNPLNWWRTVRAIRRTIRKEQPDVIQVHQANSYAVYACVANFKLHVPLVLTVWGSDVLLAPKQNPMLRPLVRWVLRSADALTAGSKTLAAAAQAWVPSHPLNMEVITFGVSPIEVSAEKENIVYANRLLRPLYQVDRVIRVFAEFSASRPDELWQLIVAGDGSERQSLEQLAKALNVAHQVTFTGFVPPEENRLYYAKSKVFISLPISDSAAISLLEAMYYGCIPVLSDLPAYREYIEPGVNGVIDTGGAQNIIEQGLQLHSEEVVKKNRAMIEDRAMRNAMAKRFCAVLQAVISKGASAKTTERS
jgi:glycosyltransferase involved in cell wall biosynthesis